jgi:hypothetical protein
MTSQRLRQRVRVEEREARVQLPVKGDRQSAFLNTRWLDADDLSCFEAPSRMFRSRLLNLPQQALGDCETGFGALSSFHICRALALRAV